jgi:hypothetical protein
VFLATCFYANFSPQLNRLGTNKMHPFIYLGFSVLLITGCGEIAYKQGASAKDYDLAKKECKSAGNEAAIEKCLEDRGWAVQNLGTIGLPDTELFATASVSEDNRNPSHIDKKTSDVDTRDTNALPSSKPDDTKQVAPESESKSDNTKAPALVRVAPAINPFEKYKINSWWKMGAGREALEQSMSSCSATLGEGHQPDKKTQTFTRAFAACMYDKGWRGLREKS